MSYIWYDKGKREMKKRNEEEKWCHKDGAGPWHLPGADPPRSLLI
jgi:hypothetical protein